LATAPLAISKLKPQGLGVEPLEFHKSKVK
jgi:hypothetical protein